MYFKNIKIQMKAKAIDVKKCFPEGMGPTSLFLDLTRTIRCKMKLCMTGLISCLLEGLIKHPRNIELLIYLTMYKNIQN